MPPKSFSVLNTIITKEGEEWEDLGPDLGPIPVSFGTLPSLSEPCFVPQWREYS